MPPPNRFKELVHYVIARCDDSTKLGATKLNKILWYVDTSAYRLSGVSLSGEVTYTKRQYGPVPNNILKTLADLTSEGKILVLEKELAGYPKYEYLSLKEPDSSRFNEQERTLIDQVCGLICDEHTAASISEMSHDLIWESAKLGEKIPVYAVLASRPDEVTDEDIAWAEGVVRRSQTQSQIA